MPTAFETCELLWPAAARVRSDHLVDVAALEEDQSRGLDRRLVFKVEENILKEDKVPHLPLAVL